MTIESQVLKCISDEKCRGILSIIKENRPLLPNDLNLTHKQYYSRLHCLLVCGLIRKTAGQYRLSSFGRIVYDWHLVMRDTISNEYWKLKALDMIGSAGIPEPEREKVLNSLIGNERLRKFLE